MKMGSLSMLVVALLAPMCFAHNATSLIRVTSDIHAVMISEGAAENMQAAFQRSQEQHEQSMDEIMKNMTNDRAIEILKENPRTNPDLIEIAESAINLDKSQRGNLRSKNSKAMEPIGGYKGADKARILLNEMLAESMEKYDREIAMCSNYYSQQCGLLWECRGEISAANYKAATSREHILAAQTQISISQDAIPRLSDELHHHQTMCKQKQKELKSQIAIVEGDIAIMTLILEKTDCDAKSNLLQANNIGVLHCTDECDRKFVSFDDDAIRHAIAQLQSKHAKELLTDSFSDLASDGNPTVEFVQGEIRELTSTQKQKPVKFKKTPPQTEVPGNPCTDPNAGGPSAAAKAAGKAACTLARTPQCYKLQSRFSQIQGGIMDERDYLKETLSMLEHHCEETELTLKTDIENEETMLKEESTKLAAAMGEESSAQENARLVAEKHTKLADDLNKMMKDCNRNYIAFETEQCGLKKIRGELAILIGGQSGKTPTFGDCQLSPWQAGECSKECAGGTLTLKRQVTRPPNLGAECLPLESKRRCNDLPCPVDCKLSQWTGWSRCSAECGGGVTNRLRDYIQQGKHNGAPCGPTSETEACNTQACEKDCELGQWSKWSTCSKMCDGGTRKRQRSIKEKALGEGKCPGMWSKARLEYKSCNMKSCVKNSDTLHCLSKVDVVLVLDASSSLGKEGWKATKEFAKNFVGAFEGKGTNAEIAILEFSGPRTWGGMGRCMGETKMKKGEKLDLDRVCKMHWIQEFEKDLNKTRANIDGAKWMKGTTLTSLALSSVETVLQKGRGDSTPIVVVVTDGKPMSSKRTKDAAKALRKKARLMFVPVTDKIAKKTMDDVNTWASRRPQENIVPVSDFAHLALHETIDHIVADMCPELESVEVPFSEEVTIR